MLRRATRAASRAAAGSAALLDGPSTSGSGLIGASAPYLSLLRPWEAAWSRGAAGDASSASPGPSQASSPSTSGQGSNQASTSGISSRVATLLMPEWAWKLGGRLTGWNQPKAPQLEGSQGAPAAAEPAKPAKGTDDPAKQQEEEEFKLYQKLQDNCVDGFTDYLRSVNSQMPQPKTIRLPSVPMHHPDYSRHIDINWLMFKLNKQNEDIGTLMEQLDKERVDREGYAVLKDPAFLDKIAQRTGVYIADEVRQFLREALDMREKGRLLLQWVKVEGRGLPKGPEDLDKLMKALRQREAQGKRSEVRWAAAGETDEDFVCPMRPSLPWLKPSATCSKTGLPLSECCMHKEVRSGVPTGTLLGARAARVQGWEMQIRQNEEDEAGERGRGLALEDKLQRAHAEEAEAQDQRAMRGRGAWKYARNDAKMRKANYRLRAPRAFPVPRHAQPLLAQREENEVQQRLRKERTGQLAARAVERALKVAGSQAGVYEDK